MNITRAGIFAIGLAAATSAYAEKPKPTAPAPPARTWYILDFNSNRCVLAANAANGAMGKSPQEAHLRLRELGLTDATKVNKNGDGEVTFVIISIQRDGDETSLFWFPSKDGCEAGIIAAKHAGIIPDDADVK